MRFTTPGGRPVELECRSGTHDRATCVHLLSRDEYGLRALDLIPGFAMDIGAYIGTIAVSLAVDGWEVIAVEPIPENQKMIWLNATLNEVQVPIISAVSRSRWVDIAYGFQNDHYWVGNLEKEGPENLRVEAMRLSATCSWIDLLKIDCEGCEWDVLGDPLVATIPVIVGEIHGRSQEALVKLLPRHQVEFISDYVFQARL